MLWSSKYPNVLTGETKIFHLCFRTIANFTSKSLLMPLAIVSCLTEGLKPLLIITGPKSIRRASRRRLWRLTDTSTNILVWMHMSLMCLVRNHEIVTIDRTLCLIFARWFILGQYSEGPKAFWPVWSITQFLVLILGELLLYEFEIFLI